MSDPVVMAQVPGALARLRAEGPRGMITLRAKPGLPGLEAAVRAATGCALPGQRRIERAGDCAAGWMGPDEILLILPPADVARALAGIGAALAGQHHLAADVSDARAVFRIEGPEADQVLRKLAPVDFDLLTPGELRRTRLAQVAAAFWREGDGFTLVCFRSVAGYVAGVLEHSARPGSGLQL